MSVCGNRMFDLLECSICLLRMKRPLQLTCGHTFCSECIDKLVCGGRVLCPECRQETNIPPGGLSTNFHLLRVISLFEERDQGHTLLCHGCANPFLGDSHFLCKSCRKDFICALCCLREHKNHEVEEKRRATVEEIENANDTINGEVASSLHGLYTIEELWDFSSLYASLVECTDDMFEAYEQIASKLQSKTVFHGELSDAINTVTIISDMFSNVRSRIESHQKEMVASCLSEISEFSEALKNVLLVHNRESDTRSEVQGSAVQLHADSNVSN